MPCQTLPQKILFNLGEFAQYKKKLSKRFRNPDSLTWGDPVFCFVIQEIVKFDYLPGAVHP